MAQSNAQLGIRTLFQWLNGSPEAYETIPEARVITGFGLTKPEEEVTHMESPDDAVERIPGLKDGNQLTIEGNLTEASREMVEALVATTDQQEFRQVIPAPLDQTRYFAGAVTGYTEGAYTPGQPIQYQLTMRITRPPSASSPA